MTKYLVRVNGRTLTAEEALKEFALVELATFMDNDTMELANSNCPEDCSDVEWLELYLNLTDRDLITG